MDFSSFIAVMTPFTKLLITVTFFLACAFATIASDDKNTSPAITISTNASSNTQVVCYTGGLAPLRANYSHCVRATRLLPNWVMPGSFHRQDPRDVFRLPRSARYKSCIVFVSLVGLDGEPDQSTWHRIRNGASQVAAACRTPGVSVLTTGGLLYVGDRGKIRISMQKSVKGPLSVDNITISTAIA